MGNCLGKLDADAVARRRSLDLLSATDGDRDRDTQKLSSSLSLALKATKRDFRFSLGRRHPHRNDPRSVSPPPFDALAYESPPKRPRRHTSISPETDDKSELPTLFGDKSSFVSPPSIKSPAAMFDNSNLRRCIIEDIERLDVGDKIVIALTEKSNKFGVIRQKLGDDLTMNMTSRFDRTYYQFRAVVKSYEHRSELSQGTPTERHMKKWLRDGDGFTVTFIDYNLSFPVRMKDCHDSSTEVWEPKSDAFLGHDWYGALGHKRDPTICRAFYERMLKEVEGDRCQTLEIIVAALRLVLFTSFYSIYNNNLTIFFHVQQETRGFHA